MMTDKKEKKRTEGQTISKEASTRCSVDDALFNKVHQNDDACNI